MGEGQQEGDKTEDPTPHKLREAKKKGQVVYSREATTAALLLASFLTFRYIAPTLWGKMLEMATFSFEMIPEAAHELSWTLIGHICLAGVLALFLGLGPLLLIIFLVAMLAGLFQTGFNSSGYPLTPNLDRLNPFSGFKRIFFSLQGVIEMIKSVVKILIVFYVVIRTFEQFLPQILGVSGMHPGEIIGLVGNIVFAVAIRVGLIYLAIALFDYLWKYWDFMRQMKMTKQEIKEEYKRLEGDPLIKQRIRQMQMQMAQQRMMASVPKADVVVTNPIHLAVAVKYDAKKMSAPTITAKGKRLIAAEIVRLAEDNKVPVVQNEPLAQALFPLKVDSEIPIDLYKTVAEILAFVYKLKKERLPAKAIKTPQPIKLRNPLFPED